MALNSTPTGLIITSASALTPTSTPAGPQPAPTPYVKAVEGTGYFQKTRIPQGQRTLTAEALQFTFCDVTDFAERPFGNLFSSLRLPVTATQRQALRQAVAGTALASLETVEKVVVVAAPPNTYGEMIDGKSIVFQVPVLVEGDVELYTLYGGYYEFNNNLNNQYSDTNPVSGLLGVTPTPENDFNTNIAYLFCNQLQRPKDTITSVSVNTGSVTVAARSSVAIPLSLLASTTYRTGLLQNTSLRLGVRFAVGDYEMAQASEAGQLTSTTFRLRQAATHLLVYNDGYSPITVDAAVERVEVVSTRNWGGWSPTNRYPQTPNGSGKVVAALQDLTFSGIVDEPVGIAYLDKGLIVLTHPTLVEGISRDGASCVIDGGLDNAVPSTGPFTALYYDDPDLSFLTYRSVSTEYTQTFTCLAGIGEFFQTTNPTYALAYSDTTEDQPLYITQLGLYNKYSELVAIAKTSQPLAKLRNRSQQFTVSLRV